MALHQNAFFILFFTYRFQLVRAVFHVSKLRPVQTPLPKTKSSARVFRAKLIPCNRSVTSTGARDFPPSAPPPVPALGSGARLDCTNSACHAYRWRIILSALVRAVTGPFNWRCLWDTPRASASSAAEPFDVD